MDSTLAVIGGADGPTSVFLASGGSLLLSGLIVVVAYFIGNISPAILISKTKGSDIRQTGSGNAGTTNMLRAYGKKAAAATLGIDLLKGVAAVVLGAVAGGPFVSYLCADAVILGHIWPVLYGFRGGKGVATGLGVLLAVSPVMGLVAGVLAFSVIGWSKRVSVGAMTAAAAVPFLVYYFVPAFLPYGIFMVSMIVLKHRGNLKRIFKGEEPKIKL
jgi:glycerol-3-phosphate acyltransferase PlsY